MFSFGSSEPKKSIFDSSEPNMFSFGSSEPKKFSFDKSQSKEDLESRAGRAAKRAKAAMKVHQVSKEFVTIREVGQHQVFAIEEAFAVISSKVGLPAAMPVEVVAALSNFATRLDAMDERQRVINNNMKERIDTMDEQINSMKNQLTRQK
jgi:hypothetical protein